MKKLCLVLFLVAAMLLCGCGKKEEPKKIVNNSLPDITQFDFSTPTPQPTESIRYSPRGNYTFNGIGGYSGHFYIYSVDYSSNIVEISYYYYPNGPEGVCEDSGGVLKLTADIKDIGETGRSVVLELKNGDVLKFEGSSSGKGAAYYNEYVKLKHEG